MTKAQLLSYAAENGITGTTSKMTKQTIIDTITGSK